MANLSVAIATCKFMCSCTEVLKFLLEAYEGILALHQILYLQEFLALKCAR